MEKSDQAQAHARSSSSHELSSVVGKGDEPEAVNTGCGWGRFRPAILAPFAHVWTFIVLYIVSCFTHSINGSYSNVVLTTIERRFNLSSALAGMILNIAILGYVCSVIFVSFFFAKKNKPLLFAGCMLFTSISAFLYVLPHVLYGTGNDAIDAARAQRLTFFNNTAPPKSGGGAVQLCADTTALGGPAEVESTCSTAERQTFAEGVSVVTPAVVMFAVAEIMHGFAGAPMWTIGLAFIDDHTNPELSAKLIGLMYTVRMIAPITAFGMGGYFLSIYANLKETELTPQHPQWIGAWWLGFLIITVVNLLISIPTSMLPRNLRPIRKSPSFSPASPGKGNKCSEEEEKKVDAKEEGEQKEKEEKEEEKEQITMKDKVEGKEDDKKEDEKKEEQQNIKYMTGSILALAKEQESWSGPNKSTEKSSAKWKEFLKALVRLITNPIYMLELMAMCIDWSALGFMGFLPKYFEVHFQKTASIASLLGGMIPTIFAAMGSYVGGVVSGKIKGIDGGVAGLCRMNFSLSVITLLMIVPIMFLSCPDVPYSGQVVNRRLNLTTDCNANCGCSSNAFDPVCGSDGLLYFSPCHAGCTQQANSTAKPSDPSGRLVRSAECLCVAEAERRDEDEKEGVVYAGFCDNSCVSLIPYILILTAIYFASSLNNASETTIFLRCNREEDKSIALGLQVFFICVCIFPSPSLFGMVFDWSCILKKTTSCTTSEGSCLLYDRHALRLGIHGLSIAIKLISTTLYFVAYLVARRKRFQLTAQERSVSNLTECTSYG